MAGFLFTVAVVFFLTPIVIATIATVFGIKR
jgi:hypothetical protein